MGRRKKENVGTEYEIETDSISIHYKITDESFDHEFGTEYRYGYEITDCQIFIEDLNDWIDITAELPSFPNLEKFIESKIESEMGDE